MPSLLTSSLLATVLDGTTTSTTTGTSKPGSSSTIFLVLILAFAAVYFLFLRPRQKRQRQAGQQATNTLAIGDEVISAGGILGVVTAVAGDEVVVEVGPGQSLTFWRRAINLRTAVKGAPQSTSSVDFDEVVDVDEDAGYDEDDADEAEYEDDDNEDADGHGDIPDAAPTGSWDDEAEAPVEDGHDAPGGTGEGR
jgi:preprotein translocase subunit YajC